jgi:hypothetical protein
MALCDDVNLPTNQRSPNKIPQWIYWLGKKMMKNTNSIRPTDGTKGNFRQAQFYIEKNCLRWALSDIACTKTISRHSCPENIITGPYKIAQ